MSYYDYGKGYIIMPGKNAAVGSLVCGIISVVLSFTGVTVYGPLVGLILGIVALILAANSKKAGFEGGIRKGGLVLGILGTIFNGITFVACVLCVGGIAALAGASY